MKKFVEFLLFLIFGIVSIFAQNLNENVQNRRDLVYTPEQQRLRILPSDIRLVPETKLETKGYHLYIKKRPGIESVMLTETAKDPDGINDSYAYRAMEYNPINGDEIRYLDGKPLVSEGARFSLIDSSPEPDDVFGQAFHIYIPSKIQFGYEWTRNGVIEIGKGTFINIRTFERKFGDYEGNFMDSPFMFDLQTRPKKTAPKKQTVSKPEPVPEPEPPKKTVKQKKVEKSEPPAPIEEPEIKEPVAEEPAEDEQEVTVLTDEYNAVANDKFKEISQWMILSKGPETIIQDILASVDRIEGRALADIVFAIDATGSMKDDIDKLKTELIPALVEKFEEFEGVRIGLLFYRDYGDSFKYKSLPVRCYGFTADYKLFNKNLNSLVINGKEGGDIPEAVYEALFASEEFYDWNSDAAKKIILIGDAEPHPRPRGTGKYTKDLVMKKAEEKGIAIDAILLPSN